MDNDKKPEQQAPIPLTAEFGTLTARGVFMVADRHFVDRRLTRKEQKLAKAGSLFMATNESDRDACFLVEMLNRLRVSPSDPEITLEWLDERLTEQDIYLTVTYILQGVTGVKKALSSASES